MMLRPPCYVCARVRAQGAVGVGAVRVRCVGVRVRASVWYAMMMCVSRAFSALRCWASVLVRKSY